MTNTKHTPGPWKSQGEIEFIPGDRETARNRRFQIYNESGKFAHIATVNDEANARLIAAAPELLERLYYLGGGNVYLEDFRRLCFCDRHGKGNEHATVCDDAWKAYAKATGEAA